MDTFDNRSRAPVLVPVGSENILGATRSNLYCQRYHWLLPGVENLENFDLEKTTNGTKNRISTA
jgi:hypothetical protein